MVKKYYMEKCFEFLVSLIASIENNVSKVVRSKGKNSFYYFGNISWNTYLVEKEFVFMCTQVSIALLNVSGPISCPKIFS